MKVYNFFCKGRQTVVPAFSCSRIDSEILAFDITQFGHSPPKAIEGR